MIPASDIRTGQDGETRQGSPCIRFHDVTLGYGRRPAVHHLDGDLLRGSLTAVVGPNGAGKSTLLKGLVGALRPLGGRIEFTGERDIAYLPQASSIDRTFPILVHDVVSTGCWRETGLFGGVGRAMLERIAEAVAAVGLSGFERRPIGSLSGGQMQRVLFARLLVQDAPIVLLDEPFTAIDAKTTADLMAILMRWHGQEKTVIAVLHDIELVRGTFPETLLVAREAVAWGRTGEVLRPENLLRARAMVEAHDPDAGACAA